MSAGRWGRRAAAALLFAGMVGCERDSAVPEAIVTVESARVRSPDQRHDAVVTAERGAPAVGVVNYVFIVSAGRRSRVPTTPLWRPGTSHRRCRWNGSRLTSWS